MSLIDRTGNPLTAPLRRRLLAGAIAAAALTGLSAHPVIAQTIYVTDGAVQSNSTPFTYGSISVSGTDSNSNPSTYNADALLTLTGYLQAWNHGVFNVNADVSISNDAWSNSGGVINLNAGTLSASGELFFDGAGSVTRSAGSYSTNSLALWGATVGYESGDSITSDISLKYGAALTLAKDLNISGDITVDGAATSLVSTGQAISAGLLIVDHGASVTLDQNLTLSGYLFLQNGGSITHTSGTISALGFSVDAAALDLLASDTFSPSFSSYVANGGFVNAPAGAALGYLSVSGTNGNGDRATFNVNGDVSLVNASASSAGVINLISGTLSASQGLSFDGVGSATRSAGSYSTNSLTLSNGATLGYGSGDSITSSVSLASNAALTLAKDLNVSGGITVDGFATSLVSAGHALSASSLSVNYAAAVTLDQNLTLSSYLYLTYGGSITRTSETISALGFSVDAAALDLLASDTFSPSYSSYVQNGGFVNAPAGTALGSLIVSGTFFGNGQRATFNTNGNVSLVNASAYSDGIINLNNGTLSASQGLSFDGAGSVTRSGGSYSTNSLTLSNGASLSYDAGDTITSSVSLASGAALTLAKDLNVLGNITVDGAATSLASAGQAISAGSLTVNNGATVTLDQNLTLSGYLYLQNGGAIARTAEAISALAFSVDNATLDLLAGDTFSPSYSSYVQNGALVNAPAGTSLGYLIVTGTNGNGDRATFNVNGDTSIVSATAYSAGVINLITGTLSASQGLSFDGVGSVTRSAGNYSTNNLTLSNGASLSYDAGDTITSSVSLASGATLTLAKDLNLSGSITVDGAATSLVSAGQAISAESLNVSNGANFTLDQNLTLSSYLDLTNGGSITRTSETISAPAFYVKNATLDLLAGDTFSPSPSSVQNGALVNAPAGISLGDLYVSGTNGNGNRATFNVNGDASIVSADVYSDGVINLIAGTLSASNLSLDGVGSAGQAGGNYDVTNLFLSGGAMLTFGLGDSIDSLSVAGAGSLLDALAPLTLSSLYLNGGVLNLGAFTGTGAISNWGLRMSGDDTSLLQGLISGGLLTAGFSPLSVIFDAGSNMTYVTLVSAPVPEIDPNTAHGAVVLLVGALGLLERRLRRAAIARHAA